MKKINFKNGFTLIELLASMAVLAIISAVAIGGTFAYLNNANEKKYREDAEGIVEAYHGWYSQNSSSVRNLTADEALYQFITNEKNGLEYYDYNPLSFNYYLNSDSIKDESGIDHYYAQLLFDSSDFSCSIPFEISRKSDDIENGRLLYSESAEPTLYENRIEALTALKIKENSLSLGVFQNNIGRKVTEVQVLKSNALDSIYVRNNKTISGDKYSDSTWIDYTGSGNSGTISLMNGTIKVDLSIKYTIPENAVPTKYIGDAKIDDTGNYSSVVVYKEYNYSYDDSKLTSLVYDGVVVKYTRVSRTVVDKYTSSITAKRSNIFSSDWKVNSSWTAEKLDSSTKGSYIASSATYAKFDTLKEASNYIYSPLGGIDGSNTIYSAVWDTNDKVRNPVATGTWLGNDPYVDLGKYDDGGLLSNTRTYIRYYTVSYSQAYYDTSSFNIYVGTTTLNENFKVPSSFTLNLNYNNNISNDNGTDAITLYKRDISGYATYRQYNKLTINSGVTLDVSDGYFKVGGLMKPADTKNKKDNIGAYSTVENNGQILIGQSGLEVLGYITGSGTIKMADGVTSSTIWERAEILDYINDANSCTNITSINQGISSNRNTSQNWGATIGNFLVNNGFTTYIESKYARGLFSKYDASAIKCKIEITSGLDYYLKFMTNFDNNNGTTNDALRILDWKLFGSSNSVFRIVSGIVYKSIDSQSSMIFETNSNAQVVNDKDYAFTEYWKKLYVPILSSGEFTVSSTYCTVPLYNMKIKFTGTSSLTIARSYIEVLPGSSLEFADSSSLIINAYKDNDCKLAIMSKSDFSWYAQFGNSIASLLTFYGESADGLLSIKDNATLSYIKGILAGNVISNKSYTISSPTYAFDLSYAGSWGNGTLSRGYKSLSLTLN